MSTCPKYSDMEPISDEIRKELFDVSGALPDGLTEEQQQSWMRFGEFAERWRVYRDSKVPVARHLLECNGVRLFPRGDLIAITGKEKSGKTTACRMFVSAAMGSQDYGMQPREQGLRVLWLDTEQFVSNVRNIARCLEAMCHRTITADELYLTSLRGRDALDSMADMQLSLLYFFNAFRPDLVVVDGIRDYLENFNDIEQSLNLIRLCMTLSMGVSKEEAAMRHLNEREPCCVVCILHQNKPKDDNNMMGHLGATLAKKAGEIWECSYDRDQREYKLEQGSSRYRPLEHAITYTIETQTLQTEFDPEPEEMGIPRPLSPTLTPERGKGVDSSDGTRRASEREKPKYYRNIEEFMRYNDLREAFAEAFDGDKILRGSELCHRFSNIHNIGSKMYELLRVKAYEEHIIFRNAINSHHVQYALSDSDFSTTAKQNTLEL